MTGSYRIPMPVKDSEQEYYNRILKRGEGSGSGNERVS